MITEIFTRRKHNFTHLGRVDGRLGRTLGLLLDNTKSLPKPFMTYCHCNLRSNHQWNFNQDMKLSIPENAFENTLCKMVALFSLPYFVGCSSLLHWTHLSMYTRIASLIMEQSYICNALWNNLSKFGEYLTTKQGQQPTVYPKKYAHGFVVLCFVVVIHYLIFPYPPGLLCWHCGNLTIAPVPAKQPWWIWINTSCEIIMNDYITTTKQSTTKLCACLLGYTVRSCEIHLREISKRNTVYPKKYAHSFVVLCFVVVMQSFIMNSHEAFIHIHRGCFAGTGAIVRLPQCQWSKPGGYGKISQCITTTKHSKAKTVCIFLGIYCRNCVSTSRDVS